MLPKQEDRLDKRQNSCKIWLGTLMIAALTYKEKVSANGYNYIFLLCNYARYILIDLYGTEP